MSRIFDKPQTTADRIEYELFVISLKQKLWQIYPREIRLCDDCLVELEGAKCPVCGGLKSITVRLKLPEGEA